jgi:hypothetical protein
MTTIPPSFPAALRPLIRRRFFGDERAPERLLLTPIPSLFHALDAGTVVDGGWWPVRAADGALAVLVPQATAVLDAICCAEPGTELVSAGLAGSLGGFRVGATVEAARALLGDRFVERTSQRPLRFSAATVAHASCIADAFAAADELAAAADCVDMEAALVYAAAVEQGHRATALLLVSDELRTAPFFAVAPATWQAGLAPLVDVLNAELRPR